jgi:AcrR family transcriptional regulator
MAARKTGKAGGKSYHHGSLRQALLDAAERILARDGIQALTLRAAAREAGVSHAAPKNHFGDVKGLLSDLAASGYERLGAEMAASIREADAGRSRLAAFGMAYVAFAKANPALFLLMFRSERLDFDRPALAQAAGVTFGLLSDAAADGAEAQIALPAAARITAAWSLVHGYAMLLLDGRLDGLIGRLAPGSGPSALLESVLAGALKPSSGTET